MGRVVISIYLNIRKPVKNGFAVKLRVYHNSKTRFYSTGITATKEQFRDSYLSDRPRGDMRRLKDKIVAIESKAKTILHEMKYFTLERFERLMFAPSGAGNDIFFAYQAKIDQLKKEDQVKTARNYENSLQSLTAYLKSKGKPAKIAYGDITAPWLHSYEQWMVQRGRSLTTIGMYLRPLRHLFNSSIENGTIDKQVSPFGRGRYIIPAGANIKKALNKQSLAALFNVPLHHSDPLLKARDFFFFSYACNGINFKDISRLRYKNISGNELVFIREKTKRTRRGSSPLLIRVFLNPFAKSVIEKYGNRDRRADNLIFSIVTDQMTEEQKVKALVNFINHVNYNLKKLALMAGVDRDISTYFARHTFSTIARNSGASVEFISESLGHTSTKTTQHYLDSFEDNVRKEIAGKLMDF